MPGSGSPAEPGSPRIVASAVEIAAPAKVNLVLRILNRDRRTGYHDLETVFQAIELSDRLRIEVTDARGLTLEVEGADVGPREENLVWRAARSFVDETGVRGGHSLRLEKVVPAGAGLGGGSSDAAATLLALNALHDRPLSPSALHRLGAGLGSDVPFFLAGSATAVAWGRGERLRRLPPLPERPILLLLPEFPVSTREAYETLARRREHHGHVPDDPRFADLASIDWDWVESRCENDFETVVKAMNRTLAEATSTLRESGAALTLLAGSGSAIFGVFPDVGAAEAGKRRMEGEGWNAVVTRTLTALPRPLLVRADRS